jgi:hypothetical protein
VFLTVVLLNGAVSFPDGVTVWLVLGNGMAEAPVEALDDGSPAGDATTATVCSPPSELGAFDAAGNLSVFVTATPWHFTWAFSPGLRLTLLGRAEAVEERAKGATRNKIEDNILPLGVEKV